MVLHKRPSGIFPMTRASLNLVRDATPRVSAGVLFRWSKPADWKDLSLHGPEVTREARRQPVRAFREEFSRLRDEAWTLPKRPTLGKGATLKFRGFTEDELRTLWDEDLGLDFRSLRDSESVTISAHAGGALIVNATESLRIEEAARLAGLRKLCTEERSYDAYLAKEELLVSRTGWVIHVRALAQHFGLAEADADHIRAGCGSIAQHLIHAEDCPSADLGLSDASCYIVDSMAFSIRKMRTSEADEALIAVLGMWHAARDDWAGDTVVIGEHRKRFPRSWLYVNTREVLEVLAPGRTFRSRAGELAQWFLLPLAVLGRVQVGARDVSFGQPVLSDLLDCQNVPEVKRRAGLDLWVASLPVTDRQGFCLELGPAVTRVIMRSFKPPTGERLWGKPGVRAAERLQVKNRRAGEQDEDHDENVDELKEAWDRTKGYFDYMWSLSIAAMVWKWKPSTRALARCLLTNLATRAPKWSNDVDAVVGSPYWGKRLSEPHDGVEVFFPALGEAGTAWGVQTWMSQVDYSRMGIKTLPARRIAFLDDLECLRRDIGLYWRVPGHGWGDIAMADLRSMVRSTKLWRDARLEPLLPDEFVDHLLASTDEREGDELEPSDTWTSVSLNRARIDLGLTRVALAELVGCSPSMISRIIQGKKRISDAMAARFDAVLDLRYKTMRIDRSYSQKGVGLTFVGPKDSVS